MKIKVGDCVRIKRYVYEELSNGDASYVEKDNEGVVMNIDGSIASVQWENEQEDFWDCEDFCEEGRGFNIELKYLEIIKTNKSVRMLIKVLG